MSASSDGSFANVNLGPIAKPAAIASAATAGERVPIPTVPTRHRALMLTFHHLLDVRVTETSLPALRDGCVILRVLATPVSPLAKGTLNMYGTHGRGRSSRESMIPGSSAIARIVKVASDVKSLAVGQLVFFDPVLRSKHNPRVRYSSAVFHKTGSFSFCCTQESDIEDSSYAEYMRARVENCYPLDEARLMGKQEGGLGYQPAQLCDIAKIVWLFNGLKRVSLQPGETVVIYPSTNNNGAAACAIEREGAKVIAIPGSQSDITLLEMAPSNAEDGDVRATDATQRDLEGRLEGSVTSFVYAMEAEKEDWEPELMSSLLPLDGTCSLPPGAGVAVRCPMSQDTQIETEVFVECKKITMQGEWMYEREDVLAVINMVEKGDLKLPPTAGCLHTLSLNDWERAVEMANEGAENIVITFKS